MNYQGFKFHLMQDKRKSKNTINKPIMLLWLGHMISHAGDAIYQISLPWLILELTGSKTSTSLVAVSVYLPAVLFSLMAGVIGDRFDRRGVMIFSDGARMLFVGSLVAYLLNGGINPLIIGTFAFTVSTFGTLFYPARDALIPSLVKPEQLTSTNAFISTSGQLAHLSGPVLAGALFAWVGLNHLFTIDAVSFSVSMICIALISKKHITIQQEKEPATHIHQLKEGLQFVRKKGDLAGLITLTAVNNLFIMGPAMVGMPIFVREVLKLDFGAYAMIEAHMAGGMLAGTLFIWRFGKKINRSRVLFWGMVLDGLTYSLLYYIGNYEATKILLFIHGIGIPMITVSRTTIIQSVVPDRLRSRIFSMVSMAVIGFTALSSGLVGPLAEVVPISTIFLVIGVGAALCGVIGLNSRGIMKMEKKSG
ncbi:MAG TPA: MFS transporter [Candidatus Marinimicrobia bacterium]|nr:MFS transporter [Candidatus Neomarinimicrobiota bacterium]HIM83096.1 MFS transporter [Candidatus Neomarinimicrobiota bacterium]